jgi:glutamine amidotransferase
MIKIIDYKAGNAPSVKHSVNHLGFEAEFARSSLDLADASHIILPGVGSAKATMDSLRELDLISALEDLVLQKKVYYLGICVGMQILFEHSEEEDTNCLGWLKGQVLRFDVSRVRVPQMGWNQVRFVEKAASQFQPGGITPSSPTPSTAATCSEYLRDGKEDVHLVDEFRTPKDHFFYFVNSYHGKPENESDIWGLAEYDGLFAAAVCRDNIYATQFHIEKSGPAGLELLHSFLCLKGE